VWRRGAFGDPTVKLSFEKSQSIRKKKEEEDI
jgi:hypothetical protein